MICLVKQQLPHLVRASRCACTEHAKPRSRRARLEDVACKERSLGIVGFRLHTDARMAGTTRAKILDMHLSSTCTVASFS